MGVRLIVEILDHWQDWGLTKGEKDDLIVIAENANDGSRETYGGVHDPYILRRAGKSAKAWRNAIGGLMRKKVLAYALDAGGREVRGRTGQCARYRILFLCPLRAHAGHRGQCDPERVTSQVTQSRSPALKEGHLSDDPSKRLGHLRGASGSSERCERVIGEVTPTPLSPTTPTDRSAGRARDDVQDRKGARWLTKNWPGVTDDIAAYVIRVLRHDRRRAGTEIDHMVRYLQRMQTSGDLADYIGAAFDHFDRSPPPPSRPATQASRESPQATQPPLIFAVASKPEPTEEERQRMREETERLLAPFHKQLRQQQQGHGT